MLSQKQILEIRSHLEKAQNPVFFFDNDADGLCSYVLFRSFIEKGKGVAIRTHPDIDPGYVRKITEFNSDYVFVLDRPELGERFVNEVKALNIPIVWIDHHDIKHEYDYENLFTYNPAFSKEKSVEPVTYWTYKITELKEKMWIAIMGCVSDHHLPEFAKEFAKVYPEYWGKNIKEPFDAYYGTEIGRLSQALAFGLKDSVTHVVGLQNFLIACKSPADMYLELESGRPFGKKYREIRKKYDNLIERAKKETYDSLIFFTYGGTLSISSEISNELCHSHPKKTVVVAYNNGAMSNVSMRGKNVKEMIEKILPQFDDASGGGHMDAVGVRIKTADLPSFKEKVLNHLK